MGTIRPAAFNQTGDASDGHVVALQSGDVPTIFVSVDLLQLPEVFVKAVRDEVAKKDDSINVDNIILTATHTHTAPVLRPGTPGIPVNRDTMTVDKTIAYLANKISDGIVGAWKNLEPGTIGTSAFVACASSGSKTRASTSLISSSSRLLPSSSD